VGGFDISELKATTTYVDKRLSFSTTMREQTRDLDATGEVIFHPDHQEIHLPQLAIRTQGIEWRNDPGIDNAIQYGNRTLTLKNVRLISGNQSLDVVGSIALGDDPTGDLQVTANQVDIAALERLLLMDRGLSGQLNTKARITGALRAPAVDGRIDILNGGFREYRYESLGADLDYAGRRFVLDATLQQSPGVSITAKGSMPLSLFQKGAGAHVAATEQEQIDLRVRSTDIGLGMVEGMTTQLTEVKGTLQADVHITGAGADPHLEGYVDIKGGAFRVPAGGVAYSGLDTRIELTPDSVRVQSFAIRDEHGSPLNVSGEIAVHARQVGAINISLQATDFEVIDNELGDVGLDVLLSIGGEFLRPRVVGDIRVTAGRLELDRILQLFYDPYSVEAMPDVVSAERAAEQSGSAQEATRAALARAGSGIEPVAPLPEPPPKAPATQILADTLALDVHLRIPDNLVVRGNNLRPGGPTRAALGDLNVTFGGDLRIRKEPGSGPALLGTVNTVRGSYKFQGRTFDLVRDGTIRFVGQTPPNPIIDVTASRTIPDTGVEARVRLTGTITQPELQLSSVPPLDESDILSLIVFNRTVNELGTNQRSTLAATAGGIATGFIATPLGESIGRALDLDLFEITTTAEGDTVGAGVTIGQQIGDRVFFKLRQQFGDRTYSEFLVEYQLSDFLRVQASAAPETSGTANRIGQRRIERAGIDVIFFFSY
jgi:autotransporter translocation and assembly factor TamB